VLFSTSLAPPTPAIKFYREGIFAEDSPACSNSGGPYLSWTAGKLEAARQVCFLVPHHSRRDIEKSTPIGALFWSNPGRGVRGLGRRIQGPDSGGLGRDEGPRSIDTSSASWPDAMPGQNHAKGLGKGPKPSFQEGDRPPSRMPVANNCVVGNRHAGWAVMILAVTQA